MSTSFPINNYLINTLPKYQNLEKAVITLSDFRYQNPQNKKYSVLSQNEVGFKEFLSIMYNKRAIPYDKKKVTNIFILRTGTYISIGGFDATPQYILGLSINDTLNGIAAMYLNDTQTWIQDEKINDLQNSSFLLVLIAIAFEVVSDFVERVRGFVKALTENLKA